MKTSVYLHNDILVHTIRLSENINLDIYEPFKNSLYLQRLNLDRNRATNIIVLWE